MAEPFLWATLIIAASSLIFAGIAFRQVMKTSRSVDGFLRRADKLLNNFSTKAKGMFTPAFMGDTISHMVTSGLKNPDESQVTMPQYINGYLVAYGPSIYQDIKKEIPKYIPLLLNSNPSPPSPGAPPNKGTQLANARWGSGGLDAASKLAKATKKVPMAGKIGEAIETGQALVGLIGPARELIAEVRSIKGGGGNGDTSTPSTSPSSDGGMTDWGPPF